MTSLWRHLWPNYNTLDFKILTQGVKLLGERVLQVWWWYLHWFRRYRKKTRGGLEIAPPPPVGRGLMWPGGVTFGVIGSSFFWCQIVGWTAMVNLAALRAAVFFANCEKPKGRGITAPWPCAGYFAIWFWVSRSVRIFCHITISLASTYIYFTYIYFTYAYIYFTW